jgi:hypothetical protein
MSHKTDPGSQAGNVKRPQVPLGAGSVATGTPTGWRWSRYECAILVALGDLKISATLEARATLAPDLYHYLWARAARLEHDVQGSDSWQSADFQDHVSLQPTVDSREWLALRKL